MIYFGVSKAFDKISNHMLHTKLSAQGIYRYLLSRSCQSKIYSGFIQGSVVGPLLFTVYDDEIFENFLLGQPLMHADDLKIVYHSIDPSFPCMRFVLILT